MVETSSIEQIIAKNPGISFTELKEKTEAANGQLQYHLKKANVEKFGRGYVKKGYCRDCKLQEVCKGNCMRFFIRQENKRKILQDIDSKKKMEIAEDLDISPSTLSYHIEQLEENNLLQNGEVNPLIKQVL